MSEPDRIPALLTASEHDPKSCAYLTQSEVAALVRLSSRTLERHRVAGTGPAYMKLGRKVVYKRSCVEAWAAANTFTSTSEAEGCHD